MSNSTSRREAGDRRGTDRRAETAETYEGTERRRSDRRSGEDRRS